MGRINLITDAKNTFIVLLRKAFGHGYLQEYEYSKDPKESKIDIRKEFPKRLRKIPTIIVSMTSGDYSIDQLGPQTLIHEAKNENGVIDEIVYGGKTKITIVFTILAGSRLDRDKIIDFAAICTRFLFKEKAAEQGFEYTNIKIGSDGTATLDDTVYYTNTITITSQSEFEHNIPVELVDIIEKINIKQEVKYIDE